MLCLICIFPDLYGHKKISYIEIVKIIKQRTMIGVKATLYNLHTYKYIIILYIGIYNIIHFVMIFKLKIVLFFLLLDNRCNCNKTHVWFKSQSGDRTPTWYYNNQIKVKDLIYLKKIYTNYVIVLSSYIIFIYMHDKSTVFIYK